MKALLDFQATWCHPCRSMKPIIAELEKDYTVLEIDADQEPEKVAQYNVMSIPTYIVMDDDKEIGRIIGATTKEKLEELLRD